MEVGKPLAKKPGENPQSSKSEILLHIQKAAGAEQPKRHKVKPTGLGKSEMIPGWGIGLEIKLQRDVELVELLHKIRLSANQMTFSYQ